MKKNQRFALVSVMGMISLIFLVTGCDKSKEGGPGPGAMPPPEVSVLTVAPESVTITTELSGRVSAFLVAEVRPQVGGIVQKTLFVEGAEVNEGDILYQIDPSLYQAAYDIAKAALARANAVLPPAQSRAKRYGELAATRAISQQEADDALANAKKAEADVLSAKAAVAQARINLEYTTVKAPISGRIGKSSVTTGALVTGFQPVALATIQKLDPVYVDVAQSSTSLLKMKRRMASGLLKKGSEEEASVGLLLEDGSRYKQDGVLKFSDVTVAQGTGSVNLRSVFPNPDLTLLPGMFVRTLVEEGVNENAILVPQRAVTRNAKGEAQAMIVDASGIVQVRMLTIDRAVGNRWLISGGLETGDQVVVEGLQKIRPGGKAKTVPFGAEQEKTGASAEK